MISSWSLGLQKAFRQPYECWNTKLVRTAALLAVLSQLNATHTGNCLLLSLKVSHVSSVAYYAEGRARRIMLPSKHTPSSSNDISDDENSVVHEVQDEAHLSMHAAQALLTATPQLRKLWEIFS